eukprot:6458378-Amphidinium_carterae.3
MKRKRGQSSSARAWELTSEESNDEAVKPTIQEEADAEASDGPSIDHVQALIHRLLEANWKKETMTATLLTELCWHCEQAGLEGVGGLAVNPTAAGTGNPQRKVDAYVAKHNVAFNRLYSFALPVNMQGTQQDMIFKVRPPHCVYSFARQADLDAMVWKL